MRRNDESIRHRVAVEAARILYHREVKEYFHAKREAARRQGTIHLPSNREVHEQLLLIARQVEGDEHLPRLAAMRSLALQLMELLQEYHPRLIGSTLTGHIRRGSDVDLNLFADDVEPVLDTLRDGGYAPEVEIVLSRKGGESNEYTHIRLPDLNVEMTVYPPEELHTVPRCGITGGPMRRASLKELREVMGTTLESPVDLDALALQIPELAACRGCLQNHFHHLDVFEHTRAVVEGLERLLDFERFPAHRDQLARHFSTPESRSLLLLAGVCHDLGKPATQSYTADGRIRFLGHEVRGADIARRLKLGSPSLAKLVALHMEPVMIPGSDALPSRIHKMFAGAGDHLPELALLSLADVEAARGLAQTQERLNEHKRFVDFMLEQYFGGGEIAHPELPLSEDELEDTFGVLPPKQQARLLGWLRAAWLDGHFESAEEGLSMAAEFLEGNFPESWSGL